MPKRYLVTGCSGFLGFHLASYLIQKGHRVFGTFWNHPLKVKGVKSVHCDFKNAASVRHAIEKSRPEMIFHLAGQSNIPYSWTAFEETFQTNVFGTYYLLESVRELKLKCRVVVTGSSSEYGPLQDKKARLDENSPFRPTNPYALSKISEDLLGRIYHNNFGLPILGVIPFYVVGPRKERDALSYFAQAISRHRRGELKILPVGNLAVIRDVVDVRDGVRALDLIGEKGQSGQVYNLCTGKEISLKEVLNKMLKLSRSSMKVIADAKKFRVGDEIRIVGNPSQLTKLGWKPRYNLEETLKSILDYWAKNPD